MRNAWIAALMAVIVIMGFGCKKELKDPDKEQKYTGPTMENHDVVTLYSDSAKLLIKLQAPLQQEFENADRVFPDGLFVEFYEKEGQVTSTLKANYGKQDRNNMFEAQGNVVVQNLVKKEKLETEQLFWDKRRAKIHTDKFVRITTPEQIIMGNGLQANQDFSSYVIRDITGIIDLQE